MKLVLITPILGMRLDKENISYNLFSNILITNSKDKIESLLFNPINFLANIGAINYSKIVTDGLPCIIFQYEFDDIKFNEENYELIDKLHYKVQMFIYQMWFMADLSCFTHISFAQFDNPTLATNIHITENFLKNSSGQHDIFILTESLVSNWRSYCSENIIEIMYPLHDYEQGESILSDARTSRSKYEKFTRIQRSISFIQYARRQSWLTQKITMYIGALECLFTTDSIEITHKVSERAANFLGGTKDEIYSHYLNIKDAYKVRSNYMHGQTTAPHESLIAKSLYLDKILRKIFLKIISKYHTYFLRNKEDKKKNIKGSSIPIIEIEGLDSLLNKLSFGIGDLSH